MPLVVNIELEVVSGDSVVVSWDSVNITEIVGYIVYYSQTGRDEEDDIEASLHVSDFTDTVVVENLLSGVEYQFQVAAITAEPDGEQRIGRRSHVYTATLPVTQNKEGMVWYQEESVLLPILAV